MTVPPACLKGDRHGQSKEARCGAQEELETRQGKRQARAQDGGKARDAEKGEVQGPARGYEREETFSQEEAATGDGGGKANRNDNYRRYQGAGSRRGRSYGIRNGSYRE